MSISWDPGTYTGREISASVVFYPFANKAAYLLNQTCAKLMLSDLDNSLIKDAKQSKLVRIEGYNEMR